MKQITMLLFALLLVTYTKTYAQEKSYKEKLYYSIDAPDNDNKIYIKTKPGQKKIVIDQITWTLAGNGHDDNSSVLDGTLGPFGNAVLESKGPIGVKQFLEARDKRHTYRGLPIKKVILLKDGINQVLIEVHPGEVLELVPNGHKPYVATLIGIEQ